MEAIGIHNIALGIVLCLAVYNGVLFFTTGRSHFLFAAVMTFSFAVLQVMLTFPFGASRGAGIQLEIIFHLALLVMSLLFMSSLVHFTRTYFSLPKGRLYLFFYGALLLLLLLFSLYSFLAGNMLKAKYSIHIFSFLAQFIFIALGLVLVYSIVKQGKTGGFNGQLVFLSLLIIMGLLVVSLFFFNGTAAHQKTFSSTYYAFPFLLLSLALVTERKRRTGSNNKPVVSTPKPSAPVVPKKRAVPPSVPAGTGVKKKVRQEEKKENELPGMINFSSLLELQIQNFNNKHASRGLYIAANIRKDLYVPGDKSELTKITGILFELAESGDNRGILLSLLPKQESVELTIGEIKTGREEYQPKVARIAGILDRLQGKIFLGNKKSTGQSLSMRLQLKRMFKEDQSAAKESGKPGDAALFILANPEALSPLFEQLHRNYVIHYSTHKEKGLEAVCALQQLPDLIIVSLKNEIDAHDFCYEISREPGRVGEVPILLLVPGKPFYFDELKRGRFSPFEYLVKPVGNNKLKEVIDKLVQAEKMRRERSVEVLQSRLDTGASLQDSLEKRCTLLGLTGEEIEISKFLAEGLEIEEIVRQSAKPESYVLKLAESIYNKCDVSGRIDFINLMAR